jgi:hypothetical protein
VDNQGWGKEGHHNTMFITSNNKLMKVLKVAAEGLLDQAIMLDKNLGPKHENLLHAERVMVHAIYELIDKKWDKFEREELVTALEDDCSCGFHTK